ncbi:MAG TPA: PilZ domain-containing protein [Allosphingosinicella sp.]|nr:PilZ domain-containing protein [Allosphingosinicella sp.]
MARQKLCGEMVARCERRTVDQRSEPRRENVVDCSTLFFRGGVHVVPVVNISTRGAMIESGLVPRIGESVIIRFEGCSPIYAAVRWVKNGRIGLGFGTELILG